jgi:hypothetical protein
MRLCENCLRRHWRAKINKSTGLQVKHQNGNLVYVCIYCGNVQEEDRQFLTQPERIQANILYIDTENSTSIYENYGAKVPSKYLSYQNLVSEWFMLGWAASYVGNDKIWTCFVTPEEARCRCDAGIAHRLHALMDAAEIIAGHNVDGFDIKRCNTVFMRHGLTPIPTVGADAKKTIDTLKLARSKLAHESNCLNYLAKYYGLNGKDEITKEDWKMATAGDRQTLEKIERYCKGDVTSGKGVLEKFLPLANKKKTFGSQIKKTNEGDYE